ncbi:MAG: transposase [Epulopiscium sp.]|nr:transposase [Candidatus Epulonipiscium sp.]
MRKSYLLKLVAYMKKVFKIEDKLSLFERTLKSLSIKYKRTRPYSPWQNGKVERSHRLDNDIFYGRRRFKNYDQMIKSFNRYVSRYNNIARRVLNFKSPNQVLEEFDWSKIEAAI